MWEWSGGCSEYGYGWVWVVVFNYKQKSTCKHNRKPQNVTFQYKVTLLSTGL
jgi:hypothetical protein